MCLCESVKGTECVCVCVLNRSESDDGTCLKIANGVCAFVGVAGTTREA